MIIPVRQWISFPGETSSTPHCSSESYAQGDIALQTKSEASKPPDLVLEGCYNSGTTPAVTANPVEKVRVLVEARP